MTTAPLLELHVHLANGNKHRFVQNDPQRVQQLLQHINGRVFTQPSLTIVGENLVATYPGAALSGISLIMEPLSESLLQLLPVSQGGVQEMREITRDDYLAKQSKVRPIVAGQPFLVLSEIEFASTHRLRIETYGEAAASEIEERQILQQIFSGPALVCRRLGGGLHLWNRAQMVSYTFCPAPEAPITAWPAELVAT